jgi:3-deoxy-D-manno-octulosonate 8-phosphate phosphatase (KDO 8-P phosphatase)
MDVVSQGADDKLSALQSILKEQNLTAAQVAFVGDDVVDLAAMNASGLAVSVPNGDPRVKAAAHYVTKRAGGYGAGRETIEYVLRAQGKLERVMRDYLKGKR